MRVSSRTTLRCSSVSRLTTFSSGMTDQQKPFLRRHVPLVLVFGGVSIGMIGVAIGFIAANGLASLPVAWHSWIWLPLLGFALFAIGWITAAVGIGAHFICTDQAIWRAW